MDEMSKADPALAAMDESTMVAGMHGGNEAAYDACVRSHGYTLLAVARRILGNEEDARDAVQEAFLNAFRGMAHFDGRAQLGTWLHRIALNAAFMKLRKRRLRPE